MNDVDETETIRAEFEAKYGQVWDTKEMQQDFQPEGFGAPYIAVSRRSDGQRGSLEFQYVPRFYSFFFFNFVAAR